VGRTTILTQAICATGKSKRIGGPLFLGIDTHALSEPAAVGPCC
jgi:phosphoglucomutase